MSIDASANTYRYAQSHTEAPPYSTPSPHAAATPDAAALSHGC
jgi:hypothetical protein